MNATAAGINSTYIAGYANSITSIINSILVPTLIAVAFATFLWGIYNYFIKGADSDTDREKGRVFTLYGIIGFVVLFSVWGIVQIFMGTLGLDSATNAPAMPTIGGSTGGTVPTNSFPAYTTPGYGNGTAACTPPQVQSPEGGCYTPAGSPSAPAGDCTSGDGSLGSVCCSKDYCDSGLACSITSSGVSRCTSSASSNANVGGNGTNGASCGNMYDADCKAGLTCNQNYICSPYYSNRSCTGNSGKEFGVCSPTCPLNSGYTGDGQSTCGAGLTCCVESA